MKFIRNMPAALEHSGRPSSNPDGAKALIREEV
jgi:hypothetical protein